MSLFSRTLTTAASRVFSRRGASSFCEQRLVIELNWSPPCRTRSIHTSRPGQSVERREWGPEKCYQDRSGCKSCSSHPVQIHSPEYFIPGLKVLPLFPRGWPVYFCRLRIVTLVISYSDSKNSFAKVLKCLSNDIFSQEVNHHTPSRPVEHYSFSRFFHIRREATCKITAFFRRLDEVSSFNLPKKETLILSIAGKLNAITWSKRSKSSNNTVISFLELKLSSISSFTSYLQHKILSTNNSVITMQNYCPHITWYLPTLAWHINSSLILKNDESTRFLFREGGEGGGEG